MSTKDELRQDYFTDLVKIDEFTDRQLLESFTPILAPIIATVVLFSLIYIFLIIFCIQNDVLNFGFLNLETVGLPLQLGLMVIASGIIQLFTFALIGGISFITLIGLQQNTNSVTQDTLNLLPTSNSIIQSVRGIPGLPGPPGPQGPQGFQGLQGPQGIDGQSAEPLLVKPDLDECCQGYPGWPADPNVEIKHDPNVISQLQSQHTNSYDDETDWNYHHHSIPIYTEEIPETIYKIIDMTDIEDTEEDTSNSNPKTEEVDVDNSLNKEDENDPWYTDFSFW